jgi:peptidylamidoglycolate lyase
MNDLIPHTRRRILRAGTLAAATIGMAPYVRSGSRTAPEFHGAVIGHNGFRYRVDKLWSQADPAKYPVKDCHEMVQVSDGRLFLLTNHPQNNVLIYNKSGELLDAWTLSLNGAHGLTVHQEASGAEHLYLTDTGGRVVKTTLDGRILLELPTAADCGAYRAGEAYSPTETAVAPDGSIYVADGYGSQFILRFEAGGKFVSKFGGKGTQPSPGRFMQAHGVAIDTRGETPLLVVTERIRNEFNWFTLEGKPVRSVYLPGAYVSRPVIRGAHLYSGVCFGAKPNDYRMWQGRGFVVILDAAGRVVSCPGGRPPEYGDGALKVLLQDQPVFHNCHDVCVDDAGDLYVCQWNSKNVYPYKLHREA